MPKPTKDVIIELGKCPFCHTTIITVDDEHGPRHEESYREAWLLLSDGSRMKVGICVSCRDIMDQDMVDRLMVVHRAFWERGLEEAYKKRHEELTLQEKQQKAYYKKLNSVRFAKRERDLD